MKKITTYQNKKVLVLGLAKSGVSAAKLLHELGALVTVNDAKQFDQNPDAQDLLTLGIRVVTGGHPIELLDEEFELIVKNPGIPYTNPLVAEALTRKIPIITVAQEATAKDDLVMELSSFQLMGIETFHPQIAVITNIFEAHLDYHGSRKEYVAAKWAIQKNMTVEDTLILNWNQVELQTLAKTTAANVLPFSTKEAVEGAYLLDGKLYFNEEYIMPADELGIPGSHNIENALAAICVAKLKNVSNAQIRQTLTNFSGVPHRTQFVGEVQQRRFYNDSKATNILATEMALSGFDNQKLLLLAGGLDRGNSFDELVPALLGLKAIVLFGETKEKLAEAAKKANIETILFAENVQTAVTIAFDYSEKDDTILLSPACASWDQYPNFEVRGEAFMQAVQQLKESEM